MKQNGNTETLKRLLEKAGAESALEVMSPHWEESVRAPGAEKPFFLSRQKIRSYAEFCGFEPAGAEAIAEEAAKISRDPSLVKFAWHCHRLLAVHEDYNQFEEWPALGGIMGENHGVFYLITALSTVPAVRAKHKSMNIPEDITRRTCSQIRCFCLNYEMGNNGKYGIFLKQLSWLRHYTGGRLFRIGRMEYMIKPFQQDILVLRHRETNRTAALAGGGLKFTEAGYFPAPGSDEKAAWESTLEETRASVSGYLIDPRGRAMKKFVSLDKSKWRIMLRRDMNVLEMHIPAGGRMTLESCKSSFADAAVFFNKYFPQEKISAFASASWIFYDRLDSILPEDSNILKLQRELFLFPVPGDGRGSLWFIFFRNFENPESLPADTSLQLAVKNFLLKGGAWRNGGMFFLTEDIPRFGTGFYRNNSLGEDG